MQKINWFPGHMKKTYDHLLQDLSNYDFAIQVLDARAIQASANLELLSLFQNKPVLNIVNKSDLSDQKIQLNNTLVVHHKQELTQFVIAQLKKQWPSSPVAYYDPIRTGIVVGLPNVGKSTLINKLAKQKKQIVLDKPGTTKKITLQKITDQIYLYDTPGVMLKKIEDIANGYVLCLIGCVSQKVINLDDLLRFAIRFLKKYYLKLYRQLSDAQDLSFDDLLTYLGQKWNFWSKEKEINTALTLEKLYDLFKSGAIGKLSYDNKDLCALLIETDNKR